MAEQKNDEKPKAVSKRALRERQQTARRVYLDSSSPSVRSIARVVVIVLILLFIAGSVQAIVMSLASLAFLIVLSVFFAYLIDPLVRIIRRPFKERQSRKNNAAFVRDRDRIRVRFHDCGHRDREHRATRHRSSEGVWFEFSRLQHGLSRTSSRAQSGASTACGFLTRFNQS